MLIHLFICEMLKVTLKSEDPAAGNCSAANSEKVAEESTHLPDAQSDPYLPDTQTTYIKVGEGDLEKHVAPAAGNCSAENPEEAPPLPAPADSPPNDPLSPVIQETHPAPSDEVPTGRVDKSAINQFRLAKIF